MFCFVVFASVSDELAVYSVRAQFVIFGDLGVTGRVELDELPFASGVSAMVC